MGWRRIRGGDFVFGCDFVGVSFWLLRWQGLDRLDTRDARGYEVVAVIIFRSRTTGAASCTYRSSADRMALMAAWIESQSVDAAFQTFRGSM